MAKEAYYFSHDTNARNDPKLIKVLMKLGQTGKGVYWDLVEMLYEQGGYLQLSECDSYAFALRSDSDCLQSLINDFDLFQNDGERFWSNSILRRLEIRQAKSAKAAESAAKRWNDANAKQTQSDGNAIKGKDSIVKDKKEKDYKATPKDLDMVLDYFKEKGIINPELQAAKFYNFYEACGWVQGKKKAAIKSWRACAATWSMDKTPQSEGKKIIGYVDIKDIDHSGGSAQMIIVGEKPVYEGETIPFGMRRI